MAKKPNPQFSEYEPEKIWRAPNYDEVNNDSFACKCNVDG